MYKTKIYFDSKLIQIPKIFVQEDLSKLENKILFAQAIRKAIKRHNQVKTRKPKIRNLK